MVSLSALQHQLPLPLLPQAIGSYGAGLIDIEELQAVECHALPGSGACGGMFTANTMASSVEALGMALPGPASSHQAPPTSSLTAPLLFISFLRHGLCPCRYTW